jgi:hypothetical protein
VKGLLIIVIAVAVGLCGYCAYYRSATAPTAAMLEQPQGEIEWLRREFQLSDAQFESVRRKHQEYAPVCDAMCAKIIAANARLEELIQSHKTLTPVTEAALQECVRVQGECRRAMLGHVYAVGAEMLPEQGARYIAMMKARVIQPGLMSNAVISESSK